MATQKFKNLPVKTLTAETAEEIDKKINDFRKDNFVVATVPQIHPGNGPLTFCYVLFYISKKDYDEQTAGHVPCINCGKLLPKFYARCPYCKTEFGGK